MSDAPKDPKLAAKERARELRHQAWQRQKERQAHDPRLLALKEAARERRKAAYRAAKERHTAAAGEKKRAAKAEQAQARAAERTAAERALIGALRPPRPSEPVGVQLAGDPWTIN
ncbi:MAG: hypothetical protein HY908_13595 [Myxococcales bacterium]|nr:hypothetical protein [Myxococcales bacterium]